MKDTIQLHGMLRGVYPTCPSKNSTYLQVWFPIWIIVPGIIKWHKPNTGQPNSQGKQNRSMPNPFIIMHPCGSISQAWWAWLCTLSASRCKKHLMTTHTCTIENMVHFLVKRRVCNDSDFIWNLNSTDCKYPAWIWLYSLCGQSDQPIH